MESFERVCQMSLDIPRNSTEKKSLIFFKKSSLCSFTLEDCRQFRADLTVYAIWACFLLLLHAARLANTSFFNGFSLYKLYRLT